jgi:SAM-dependent methyltransferase
MNHSDLVPRYLTGLGVEIGAFKTPIPGIKPVYVDLFSQYAGEPTLAEYYGDACNLPFHDSSLQYVASSHVLEHVANPLAALAEWVRVLEHGGIIYMVIPDRRKTFDHLRPPTAPSHFLDDFRKGVNQCDGTHIRDFVYGVDWRQFSPSTAPEDEAAARDAQARQYEHAIASGAQINIHFHSFEPGNAVEMIELGNREAVWEGRIQVLKVAEEFPATCPNGILVLARVGKPLKARLKALFSRKGLRADARKP